MCFARCLIVMGLLAGTAWADEISDAVIETVVEAGLAKAVARLKPLAVLKG